VEFCSNDDFNGFLHQAFETVESLRVEIADMMQEKWPNRMISKLNFLLLSNSRRFESIKTLIIPKCGITSHLTLLIRALPSLRHLYGERYCGKSELDGQNGLISPNLTTLAFSIVPSGGYDPIKLHLPSLRHLRVDADEGVVLAFVKSVILNILRVTGHQLRSFHLHYVAPRNEPFEDVWHLCPKMGSFRTPFSLSTPPLIHPIHTLLIHRVEQLEGLDPYSEWPNLRRIVLGCKWTQIDYRVREAYIPSKSGLTVEDWEGLNLDDYCEQSLAWFNPG
jgi:hypothetical protein